MNPIFIIGTERSGTNLLRLILNSHSHITVPHPPHIMKLFSPLEPHYGNLKQDDNFRALIDDVCRAVELHPYPWEIKPDRQAVFKDAIDRNLLAIYFAIYDQYREFSGKMRWACKSTFMIEHVAEILACHPGAQFLFLVRDGRDVAVSAKSSIFNHYHVYYSAQRWKREQALGLSWLAKLPAERILLVKYEDLISRPAEETRRICAFLGEPFEETMLEYHRSAEAAKSGSLSISWQNTAKPVLAANANKFRRHLSDDEILLFEAIAAEELIKLGYRLSHPLGTLQELHPVMMRDRIHYRLSEILSRLRTETLHLIRDKNSLMRLRKIAHLHLVRLRRRLAGLHA